MLSETIAHLTRKIAEELDLLSGRWSPPTRSVPQLPPISPTTELEPCKDTPSEEHGAGCEAEAGAKMAPGGLRRRSLREILDWRRYKVN